MAFNRVKNLTTVQKVMLGSSGGRPNLWISKYLHRKINVLLAPDPHRFKDGSERRIGVSIEKQKHLSVQGKMKHEP